MPELGLAAAQPNLDSACAMSVERVRIAGPTLTGACAAFQGSSAAAGAAASNATAVVDPDDSAVAMM